MRGRALNNLGRGAKPNEQQLQTITLKGGILRAYEALGGWEGLAEWGKLNPTDFYTKVLVKLIALELDVRKADPVNVEVKLHAKQDKAPLVLDNDTGAEVMPEMPGLYRDIERLVSRG
jgi:hypothetical protein